MIELSGVSILSAFGAGLISFLSPCVLPLVPGYISYIGGQSIDEIREQGRSIRETLDILYLSLCFVLGFSTVFISFGAGASAIGQLLSTYRYEINIIGGMVIVLFGLFMMGLLRMSWLQGEFRFHGKVPGGRPMAAGLLGIAFAFGWTPCIGPILGAILTVSAAMGLVSYGSALLAIYSLGLAVPFILAALFTNWFLGHRRGLQGKGRLLHKLAGALLVVMGIAMITGYLSRFAFWLLKVFPILGQVG